VSAAHVYLTYPFVLSWSMLEAMASGCLVIGSKTAPVQEVIEHGVNGLLVDFFNAAEIADAVVGALGDLKGTSDLRVRAQADVRQKYSLQQGEAAYRGLLAGG
jgi:glycosyltransferase involved in cell wall biosynthesis